SSVFFCSSRRRHTRFSRDWSSDVRSSDLQQPQEAITLSGTIKDENGNPVPHATIRLIGTQDLAVSSDNQGFFVFANISKDAQVRSEERRVWKECKSLVWPWYSYYMLRECQ